MRSEWASLPVRHLRAGELVLSHEPVVVSTILGSCISVTMFHPRIKLGAICHGLLPNGGCEEMTAEALRYVDCSIHHMIRRLETLGAQPGQLQIKLFGGADVLVHPSAGDGRTSIGAQNVRAASLALEEEGLHVLAHDVGGERGRRLFFLPHTGEVYVKRLRKLSHAHCGPTGKSVKRVSRGGGP